MTEKRSIWSAVTDPESRLRRNKIAAAAIIAGGAVALELMGVRIAETTGNPAIATFLDQQALKSTLVVAVPLTIVERLRNSDK